MFGAALVTPERAVFVGAAEQVDLPGSEGDLGILTGHAPLITTLRPGIVRVIASGRDERFVVLGGIAEFSRSELTVLAETAVPAAERDTINLVTRIEQLEQRIKADSLGDELDRKIRMLDHYKTLQQNLTITTAL